MSIMEHITDREQIREAMEDDAPAQCGGVLRAMEPGRFYTERLMDIILSTNYRARLAYRNDVEFKVTLDALVNGIRRTVDLMAADAERRQEQQRHLMEHLFTEPQIRFDLGLFGSPKGSDVRPE